MNRTRVGVAIILVMLALAARLIPGPRTIDDAYITFRYARNLLDGQGFVYNPGETVMGTTTPLYTFLMVGLGALSGGTQANFPAIANLVNALADSLTCLLLWQLGRKLGSEWAGAAAGLLWAIAPYSVAFAIGGLETSLYVFLLTTVVWCYLDKRPVGAGLAAAGAFLTRIDALILLGPLALYWLVRAFRKQETLPMRAILAAGLPVIAWWVFATVAFGSPIPQSVQAKLVAYRLEPGASFLRLLQHYATPFLDYNILGPGVGVGLGLVLYPFLALVGARAAYRSEPRSLPWLIYPWLYFAAFAIPNPLIFRWYLTPPLPAWFLLIVLGAAQLVRAIPGAAWRRWALGFVLLALAVVSTLGDWRYHPDHGPGRPAPDMAYIQLELLYEQAAEVVKPHLGPDSVLAAGDVGVLGYRTGARILDLVGLNSPQVKRYYPLDPAMYVINYAVSPDLIMDELPDAVVILEVYGRKGLLVDSRFKDRYLMLQKIDTDMYGSDGLLIFLKKQ
jgi:4-amino-4-deoxy-L-arabinose transferase-like glycosyltransferase